VNPQRQRRFAQYQGRATGRFSVAYVSPPKVVYTGDAGSQILLVETQYLSPAFTPEGLKPSVNAFDLDYALKLPDGRTTPLAFLGVRHANQLDALDHIFYDPRRDSWVGIGVSLGVHSEHLKGMQWRRVEDDFISIRVKAFTRDRLISQRDLSVCNPKRMVNPAIQFVPVSNTLRYCTKGGLAQYDPLTDAESMLDHGACCPTASREITDMTTRVLEQDYVAVQTH
jgi:hypothetical protein